MKGLIEGGKVVRTSNAVAAGTTAVNGTGVDSAGAESVVLLAVMGAVTTAPVIKAQQSDDDGVADGWSDLEDSALTIVDTDDNLVAVIEVVQPLKRYVRMVMDRAAGNVVVDAMLAIVHNLAEKPTTQPASVADAVVLNEPAEGTA